MDEMISRSAAIEAIEKHIRTAEEPYQLTDADKVMNHAFEIAASCVYNLSAAEAEVRTQMPSADCISRHDVSEWLSNRGYRGLANKVMDEDRFPSAQPERKRGRWIYGEDNLGTGRDGWFCSECGHFELWDYNADMKSAELNLPNYCPSCGAEMEVSE